jgi:hypothetical protein
VHEEGPYLGRIVARVEECIFAAGAVVASVKRLALAPPSTAGQDTSREVRGGLIQRLSHKIGAVLDQLGVYAKNSLQRLFPLLRRIVGCLQPTYGGAYKMLQCWNVSEDSLSDGEKH